MTILIRALLALFLISPTFAKSPTSLAPSIPATIAAPLPDDALGATIHRLPNGLTVYLSPNHNEPRIAARIVVRAGSKNDPADSTGMAHYLEHMLFKGTSRLGTLDYNQERPHLETIRGLYEQLFTAKDDNRRKDIYGRIDSENIKASKYAVPNEIDRFYRSIGADGLNAFTSDEQTVYTVNIPANRLEAWAAMEAERFKNPVFRLFQSELETVYEEKNRSLDNAERILADEVESRLYKRHPYGQQPTIGTIEHLKNPSLAKMYAFYDAWYVPNNMAVVLSGDFDRTAALEVITRRFADWKPRALPRLPQWELPAPRGEESYDVRYEAEQVTALSWLLPPHSHADADALEVMDMVVDNAAAGLLNLRLNQAQKVKSSASYLSLRNDSGSWNLRGSAKKDQTLEQVKELLLGVVDALKAGDFSEDDVAAVILNFEIDEKRNLESSEARANKMAASFVSLQPWERDAGHLERLKKITKADVVRVANLYLTNDRVVINRRDGKPEIQKIAKPSFTSVTIDPSRESTFLGQLLALPAPQLEPRWLTAGQDYTIAPVEGGKLFATKNPFNDLFQINFRYDRGSRSERQLCHAVDLLEHSGAGPWTAEQLKRKLYSLGVSLSYACDDTTVKVHMTGPDRNFWPALELMSQRFDWPNIEADALPKMIDIELGARADEKKTPGPLFYALGQVALRGRDSVVLNRLSDTELKGLSEIKLKKLIRELPAYPSRIAYVGNRSAGEIAQLLRNGRRPLSLPPRLPLRLLRPTANRILFVHRDMVQAQVGLSAGDDISDPERFVDYQVFSEYMGGDMSSVIFQEVREARSLAYSAGGGHTYGVNKNDDTQLWGRLGCQADKTPEAVKLMMDLLTHLPASEQRFQETIRSLEQSYRSSPVAFRSIPDTVMSWEDQGLEKGDPGPTRFKNILGYTLADLTKFAARFNSSPMTVWILGDRQRVPLEQLKPLGNLEDKPLESLFPY